MNGSLPYRYEFDSFRLEPSKRLLWRDGQTVSLMPKAFEVLLVLVRRHGQTVTKHELLDTVWHDTAVEENNLNVNISALRKVFGEKPHEHHFIVTVPGVGYQFVADVHEVWDEAIVSEPRCQIDNGLSGGAASGLTSRFELSVEVPDSRPEPLAGAGSSGLLFKRPLLLKIGAVVILIGTGLGLWHWRNRLLAGSKTTAPFQTARFTKLTTGKALQAAVSPDGKHVAYVKEDAGGQSLWLRQVAIDSEVRVVSPKEIEYLGVAYGRDGDFVYYLTREPNNNGGALYELPTLGGAPRRILSEVYDSFALSHDGKRVAFFRVAREGAAILMVANLDGTGEKVVFSHNREAEHLWIQSPPAWSPDDSRVVYLIFKEHEGYISKFVAVRLSDCRFEDITPLEWVLAEGVEWTADGLYVSAQHRGEDQFQLWHINPADGTARKLTTALQDHYGVSLTKDGRTLATVQNVELMNIWVLPLSETGATRQITAGGAFTLTSLLRPTVNCSIPRARAGWRTSGRRTRTALTVGN